MTSSMKPYDKAQLADDLSKLIDAPLICKTDLESWNHVACIVRERLAIGNAAELEPLPESIWDYLADAEVRLYDPDYAAAQHRIISRLIDRLHSESESIRAVVG